ncbi:hypothetical protein EDD11_007863 [Mortierella claussenii]|nr:hypothetical protein EDD11_007863 [Mortierella claussenii]
MMMFTTPSTHPSKATSNTHHHKGTTTTMKFIALAFFFVLTATQVVSIPDTTYYWCESKTTNGLCYSGVNVDCDFTIDCNVVNQNCGACGHPGAINNWCNQNQGTVVSGPYLSYLAHCTESKNGN